MKTLTVKLTLQEGMLGTSPANPDIYSDFIGSNAPDAATLQDEIEALGVNAVTEKGRTIFPRLEDGTPFVYDYQIKGFFKDACGVLRYIPSSKSKALTSYKKKIDGLVFVYPRKIPIVLSGEITDCSRPLRAQTAQGERVSLASSDEVPAGSTLTFDVELMDDGMEKTLLEWLDYGKKRGLGQWRNSGKGRYLFELFDENGEKIGGNR